jgi:hypothetical protein
VSVGRAKQALPEAMQEARRVAGAAKDASPTSVTIRLKRSDPRVRELVCLVDRLASEITTESGLVIKRERISGATDAVMNALRRCGVPVDELLRVAGISVEDRVGSFGIGLGVLSVFGGALGGPTRDAITRLKEQLQAIHEDGHLP